MVASAASQFKIPNYSCTFCELPKLFTLMSANRQRLTHSAKHTYSDILELQSHGRASRLGPVANFQDGPQ